jgi:hypothetical protein
MKTFKPYYGDPIFAGTDFYIHKRVQDIGKAANGTSQTDNNIAQIFSKQKLHAAEGAKSHYKALFFQNLKLDKDAQTLLNESFDSDNDKIISEIDKQVKEKLKKSIDQKSLETLMGEYIASASTSKLLFSAKHSVDAFNTLLDSLAKVTELIHSDLGPQLAAALLTAKKGGTLTGGMSITEMGISLEQALASFAAQNPVVPISEDKIFHVVNTLNTFATSLKTGKTSTDKKITQSVISNMVDQLFSGGFSEIIGGQIQSLTENAIDEQMSLIVGGETFQIQKTSSSGQLLGLEGSKRAGKTDILLPNVTVTIENLLNSQEAQINMNIGLSSKFYRSQAFPGVRDMSAKSLTFGGGSGGTLKEALNTIFNSSFEHYLAYNTIA